MLQPCPTGSGSGPLPVKKAFFFAPVTHDRYYTINKTEGIESNSCNKNMM